MSQLDQKVFEELFKFLVCFEGFATYMYLDQGCLVHTGIGFNIHQAWKEKGLNYPWKDNKTGHLVLRDRALKEWNLILSKKIESNCGRERGYKGAYWFKQFSTVHLTDDDVFLIFKNKVEAIHNSLQEIFPDFANFPADAQLAILIHAWNNNPPSGKQSTWPGWVNYFNACTNKKWWDADVNKSTAAKESRWTPVSRRYKYMVEIFKNAQTIEEQHKNNSKINIKTLIYKVSDELIKEHGKSNVLPLFIKRFFKPTASPTSR